MSNLPPTQPTNADLLSSQDLENALGCGLVLHVHKVEVQRLRGDRSEIVPGDVVAFVATAKIRIEQPGDLHKRFPELCANADLFTINEDAQVICAVPMHEKDIEKWLTCRYVFCFQLNGESPTVPPAPPKASDKEPEPWIILLNTSAIQGDYFDLEVDIQFQGSEPGPPERGPSPPPQERFQEFAELLGSIEFKIDGQPFTLSATRRDRQLASHAPLSPPADNKPRKRGDVRSQ